MKKINPLRLFLKTIFIFALANLLFALWNPPVERLSAYNAIFPGRTRFAFGEIDNIDAHFASHEISAPKGENEFRVIIIGDSSIWGDGLESEQSLSTWLNKLQGECFSKDVKFYNLGFPHMSAMKDLLILNKAMEYAPDAIIWSSTLRTILPKPPNPFLIANVDPIFELISEHDLWEYPYDEFDYERKTLYEKTFIGRRKELARLLRLQILGIEWLSTKSDSQPQYMPPNALPTPPVEDPNNLEKETLFRGFDENDNIIPYLWAHYFEIGEQIAGDTPIIFVNQPMFIASGANSDIRYNKGYPRWVYDQYRQFLATEADSKDRTYLDLWDKIPPKYFIGDTFHLSAEGEELLAEIMAEGFQEAICEKEE